MQTKTRMMVMSAMFTALAIVAALLIRIPVTPLVPFSLLPFVCILAGSVLGARYGAISMLVYVLMGLIGLPVFEKGGGPMYVIQPTFGFLLGFIVAAFLAGLLLGEGKNGIVKYLLASFAGVIVIYVIGLPYLYVIVNFVMGKAMPFAKVLGVAFYPFIIPDIVKAIFAAALAKIIRERVVTA